MNVKMIRNYKKEVRFLRKIGRDKILESIDAFKKNENESNILSKILESSSINNFFNEYKVYILVFIRVKLESI